MEQHRYTQRSTHTRLALLSQEHQTSYWWWSKGDSKTIFFLVREEWVLGLTHQVWTFSLYFVRSIAHTWLPNLYFSFIFCTTFVLMETDVEIFHLIFGGMYYAACECSTFNILSEPSLARTKSSIFKCTHTQIFGWANKFWHHIRYSNVT